MADRQGHRTEVRLCQAFSVCYPPTIGFKTLLHKQMADITKTAPAYNSVTAFSP